MKGLSYLNRGEIKIIIFCGKGGVGKTTCATATALHFARLGFKTLLVSTDPAPSLSDILEENVRGKVTTVEITKNLDAVELDYNIVLENWKEEFGPEVYNVISSFLPVGKEIIDYVAGAPGIDEEYALAYIYEFYRSGKYDVIVWDTAPAGGTLTLLKLQEKFYRHLGEAAALYMKLKEALAKLSGGHEKNPLTLINRWCELAENILNMVKDEKTRAIVVTIPEALGVEQTERIITELRAFGIHISAVLVNYIISEEICKCEFHRQRAKMQHKYLDILKSEYGDKLSLSILPQFAEEIKGIRSIEKIEKLLFKE